MPAIVIPWPCLCRPVRRENGFIAHSIRCPISDARTFGIPLSKLWVARKDVARSYR